MRKLKLYLKLSWIFTLSLFVPTTALTKQVEAILAELKGESEPSEHKA